MIPSKFLTDRSVADEVGATRVVVDDYLQRRVTQAQALANTIDPHYERLWQAIGSVVGQGGKRLRPYVTLLMARAFSGSDDIDRWVPVAAAHELLHIGLLVHDDIIDRDFTRHGVANIAGQYKQYYASLLAREGDVTHFANSAALLAGDLLIAEAYQALNDSDISLSTRQQVGAEFHRGLLRVAGGELLDTEASFYPAGTINIDTIIREKTSSYSFVSPLKTGALLGGASSEDLQVLEQLGNELGMAYQLRDDLLGVFGDGAVTGKSTDGDIREGKQTHLVQEFHRRATPAQQRVFRAVFGHAEASDRAIESVRELLTITGAKQAIEARCETLQAHCVDLASSLAISAEHREQLVDYISLCVERVK